MAEEHRFTLQISTPNRLVFKGSVEEATAPGIAGVFGVLAGHTEFVTFLRPGRLSYVEAGQARHVAVQGGIVEVTPTRMVVLAAAALKAEEIDPNVARHDREGAEKALKGLPYEDPAHKNLEMELEWAQVRLQVGDRRHEGRPGS